jgi:hypothetical protein
VNAAQCEANDHRPLAWNPEPRCVRCGHRVPRDGARPRRTRDLPVVLWPFELAARAEAVIRGSLLRKGKLT